MASSNSSGQLEFNREIKIPVPWGHIAGCILLHCLNHYKWNSYILIFFVFILAKIWGADGGLPVLAIHGWMDNAGSFDRLAPLLPPHIQLVCVDLCGIIAIHNVLFFNHLKFIPIHFYEIVGQGQSSHFPPGKFVMYHDYVYHVKLVIDYFKWKQIVIMGHRY